MPDIIRSPIIRLLLSPLFHTASYLIRIVMLTKIMIATPRQDQHQFIKYLDIFSFSCMNNSSDFSLYISAIKNLNFSTDWCNASINSGRFAMFTCYFDVYSFYSKISIMIIKTKHGPNFSSHQFKYLLAKSLRPLGADIIKYHQRKNNLII